MNLFLFIAILGSAPLRAADNQWIVMFDGRSLEGWKADSHPEDWSVKDGAITGEGPKSNLFWMVRECTDVNINDGGNSGMFFRKDFGPRAPKGYEAQINSTHGDPKKTGSLYNFQNVYEQLVPPGVWFTQHIVARGSNRH